MYKILKLFKDEESKVVYDTVDVDSDAININTLAKIVEEGGNSEVCLYSSLDLGGINCVVVGVGDEDKYLPTLSVTDSTMSKVLYKLSGEIYIAKIVDVASEEDDYVFLGLTDEDVDCVINNLFLVGNECFVRTDEEYAVGMAEIIFDDVELVTTPNIRNVSSVMYLMRESLGVVDLQMVDAICHG